MELYKHQQKIIKEDKKKCGLFLGTGSGKTRIALLLARGRTLVICPKTQRDDRNWQRECEKLNLDIKLTVLSKEDFKKHVGVLTRYDTIIVDEAHTSLGVTPETRFRNRLPVPKASQLFEALASFIKRTNPERLYLVTATIIRSPMTVWAAAHLLGAPWDYYKFRERFYTRFLMGYREIWKARSDSDTKDRLADAVKKLGYTGKLTDYFDVPSQQYKTVHIELTAEQKARIKTLPLEYPDAIVLIGKKHQVENGVLSGDEYNASETFLNEKLKVIMDYALEFPKIVIFAKYRAQINALEYALSQAGYNVATLTGDTKDRGEVIAKANKSKECIFIAQAQVSSGWELPTYPVMIFASMSYSVVDRVQAEGRILRANALKNNLYIDLVVKGGIDEAVYKSIKNKEDFIERIYAEKRS